MAVGIGNTGSTDPSNGTRGAFSDRKENPLIAGAGAGDAASSAIVGIVVSSTTAAVSAAGVAMDMAFMKSNPDDAAAAAVVAAIAAEEVSSGVGSVVALDESFIMNENPLVAAGTVGGGGIADMDTGSGAVEFKKEKEETPEAGAGAPGDGGGDGSGAPAFMKPNELIAGAIGAVGTAASGVGSGLLSSASLDAAPLISRPPNILLSNYRSI